MVRKLKFWKAALAVSRENSLKFGIIISILKSPVQSSLGFVRPGLDLWTTVRGDCVTQPRFWIEFSQRPFFYLLQPNLAEMSNHKAIFGENRLFNWLAQNYVLTNLVPYYLLFFLQNLATILWTLESGQGFNL